MTQDSDPDFDPSDAQAQRIPPQAGGGVVYDDRWLTEQGIGQDGEPGCSVTDLRPPRDGVTEVQYVFRHEPELAVLSLVTVHRHGVSGECEQVPPDHHTEDHEVPEEAVAITNHRLDCPVAVPGRDRGDS